MLVVSTKLQLTHAVSLAKLETASLGYVTLEIKQQIKNYIKNKINLTRRTRVFVTFKCKQ